MKKSNPLRKKPQKEERQYDPKKIKLFNIISISLIAFFFVLYASRAAYFYFRENVTPKEDAMLLDELMKKESVVDLTHGLVKNEETGAYAFKGDVNNNYLTYSGTLFRIVGIDQSSNIRVISQDTQTITICSQTDSYENSTIRKWLNELDGIEHSGLYMNSLNLPFQHLASGTVYIDKVDSLENITCNQTANDYISLLSLYDYKEAGGSNSYLNNSQNWYLSTTNSAGYPWYVSSDGGLQVADESFSVSGVRPVLSLLSSTVLISGDGTKASPYVIEEPVSPEVLYQANTGSYVNYSGYKWRIVERNSQSVKLAMQGVIKDQNEDYESKYGSSNSLSLSSSKSTVGTYLSNTFLPTLSDQSILTDGEWYTGTFSSIFGYDYSDAFARSYTGKVGLLKIGDLYLNDFPLTYTATGGFNNSKLIYSITQSGGLFADFVTKSYKIRPAVFVVGTTAIASGDGSAESPYEISSAPTDFSGSESTLQQ